VPQTLWRRKLKTIYKYPLATTDFQVIDLPEGAQILSVNIQYEKICLWAIIDTEKPVAGRRIRIIGTGNDAGDVEMGQHIGSVLAYGGTFVWHVFDVGPVMQ
jgi:hypothetical protein